MTLKQPRHSPHGFGILSTEDVPFFKQALRFVAGEFKEVRMLEIGVANGGTTIGVYNECQTFNWPLTWHGMDMECGRPAFDLGSWGTFHCGDFHKVHQQVPNGFNFLFIDGCHCYQCVTMDFEIFASKVVKRGLILFHDTNSHPSWQNHHEQCKPGRMIETRRALADLKLFPLRRTDYAFIGEQNEGTTQGLTLFQKL
jgi:hypothetical protein